MHTWSSYEPFYSGSYFSPYFTSAFIPWNPFLPFLPLCRTIVYSYHHRCRSIKRLYAVWQWIRMYEPRNPRNIVIAVLLASLIKVRSWNWNENYYHIKLEDEPPPSSPLPVDEREKAVGAELFYFAWLRFTSYSWGWRSSRQLQLSNENYCNEEKMRNSIELARDTLLYSSEFISRRLKLFVLLQVSVHVPVLMYVCMYQRPCTE